MADTEESLIRGYYQKPHQLRTDCLDLDGSTYKLVDFLADLTMGWSSRWVLLSHDEIIAGKRRTTGAHRADLRSGLKDKKTIKKAVDDALAHELIEVMYTHLGTAYAIHRRYWALAGLLPKWAFFGRVPYTAASDPIPEIPAGGFKPPERETEKPPVLLSGGLNPPSGGIEATGQVSLTHQTVVLKLPAQSPQPVPEEARREPIYTSLYTDRIDTKERYVGPSASLQAPMSSSQSKREDEDEPTNAGASTKKAAGKGSVDDTGTQDIDALAQHLADQQVLQSLLAERQSLQTLQPGQPGWGAAQRRLRAIAPEIPRLQALAGRQAEAMSDSERAASAGDTARTEERRSPAAHQPMRHIGGPPASEAADPEQIARRRRLMQLQGELAHLKKTPSMQLMARQRIPRLEEAIKHLIAQIQESA